MGPMVGPSQSSTDEPLIEPPCAVFRRFLKQQGLKFTTERAKILNTVLSKSSVFEADQLLTEMRQAGHRVSRPTIYRTLKHLRHANIIRQVLIDAKQSHYQLSIGRDPQSYLVCIETNEIFEVAAPQIDELTRKICHDHGFERVSHRLIIYGVSPKAQAAELDESGEDDAPD